MKVLHKTFIRTMSPTTNTAEDALVLAIADAIPALTRADRVAWRRRDDNTIQYVGIIAGGSQEAAHG